MNKEIKSERKNRSVYIENGRCYKVFDVGYDKSEILSEALVQSLVEKTGLNVPAILEMTTIDGKWAIVTEAVEGDTLEELMEKHPEKEDEYLNRFVDIQIDMLSKRCPALIKHKDKMNRKMYSADFLSATMRYDLNRQIEGKPRHNCLCHGDYNPSNVIINSKNVAYVVDWSHATQGNEEADAARTYMLFIVAGKNKLARKYIDLFCEKSGCQQKDILNWLPILATSQATKKREYEKDALYKIIFMDKKALEELYEQQ